MASVMGYSALKMRTISSGSNGFRSARGIVPAVSGGFIVRPAGRRILFCSIVIHECLAIPVGVSERTRRRFLAGNALASPVS
jgi:hypothetical protein